MFSAASSGATILILRPVVQRCNIVFITIENNSNTLDLANHQLDYYEDDNIHAITVISVALKR